MNERPDGIIITISAGMMKEKGYRNWLRNFLDAMGNEECTYWMRLGSIPKNEVMWVYLCIGGKIRFRANFVCYSNRPSMTFTDGKSLNARAWVVLAGPVVRAPRGQEPLLKGFRGFRYTQQLF